MAPVWEANHVWLIFVLVVVWTGYPVAFASMASTLAVALTAAGLGIILRGVAYALRSATQGDAEARAVDTLTAVGSVLAPFALAAAAGGIASLRVPVGNAAGDLWSSWLNPTSLMAGVLALLASAYLAAVYLAADARRAGDEEMVEAFRTRALVVGALAGGRGDRGRARRALGRALDLRPHRRHAGGDQRRGVAAGRGRDARARLRAGGWRPRGSARRSRSRRSSAAGRSRRARCCCRA